MTVQEILQHESTLYVLNTLIGGSFLVGLNTLIKGITDLGTSTDNPNKRKNAQQTLALGGVFIAISALLSVFIYTGILTELMISILVLETDAIDAANKTFANLRFLLNLSVGFGILSVIGSIISGVILMAVNSDNPRFRRQAIIGLFWSIISIALFGSLGAIVMIFYNLGVI